MGSVRNIALSDELCRQAEQRFSQFGTVDELLTEVLTQLLRQDAIEMDEQEQQIIEERLKGLGYV